MSDRAVACAFGPDGCRRCLEILRWRLSEHFPEACRESPISVIGLQRRTANFCFSQVTGQTQTKHYGLMHIANADRRRSESGMRSQHYYESEHDGAWTVSYAQSVRQPKSSGFVLLFRAARVDMVALEDR